MQDHRTLLRGLALTGAAAALLAGCAKTANSTDKTVTGDAAAVEQVLRADESQWNADYKAKDVAKITGHYAPDGVLMEPQAQVMNGAPAINAGISHFVADPALDIQFSADKVGVGGDLAYTRGHFKLTTTDPTTKQPVTQSGSYVTVYRKQADGTWKAVEDIATPGA